MFPHAHTLIFIFVCYNNQVLFWLLSLTSPPPISLQLICLYWDGAENEMHIKLYPILIHDDEFL